MGREGPAMLKCERRFNNVCTGLELVRFRHDVGWARNLNSRSKKYPPMSLRHYTEYLFMNTAVEGMLH